MTLRDPADDRDEIQNDEIIDAIEGFEFGEDLAELACLESDEDLLTWCRNIKAQFLKLAEEARENQKSDGDE